MKFIAKYFLLSLIFIHQVFAYNPAQQAMEDLSDSEGYSRNSAFGDFFVYLFLIALGLAFLFSSLKTKLNVFKGGLLFIVPLFLMYVLKQIFPQDWKFFAIPILLLYIFKIESIGNYVFPDEKDATKDKVTPAKENLYIDESEAQSRLNADVNAINSLYKSPNKREARDKYICPSCNEKEAVNILYGYPTDETLETWKNKEIELGGCIIEKNNPTHKCFKCGHQWYK